VENADLDGVFLRLRARYKRSCGERSACEDTSHGFANEIHGRLLTVGDLGYPAIAVPTPRFRSRQRSFMLFFSALRPKTDSPRQPENTRVACCVKWQEA
jgi:hypothetical protein